MALSLSLICGMVLLKARVLAYFSLQSSALFDVVEKSVRINLGMWFDSNLSMGDHITKTSSAAFYYLYNIRRIRKYLSKECTETLIHAFISSRIDYISHSF